MDSRFLMDLTAPFALRHTERATAQEPSSISAPTSPEDAGAMSSAALRRFPSMHRIACAVQDISDAYNILNAGLLDAQTPSEAEAIYRIAEKIQRQFDTLSLTALTIADLRNR